MSEITDQEQIVNEVISRQNNAKDGKILREVSPFLGGTLYVVGFTDSKNSSVENYAFLKKDHLRIYRFSYELFHGISKEIEPSGVLATTIGKWGIEGSIALVLTCTICYLSIQGTAILVPKHKYRHYLLTFLII